MEDRSIEKATVRRERGYIWLERELKAKLGISTAFIAVFFFALHIAEPESGVLIFAVLPAVLLNGVWTFLQYRKQYRDYLMIARYLEEFEEGNYEYHEAKNYMKAGIHSQIAEQMERIGRAFGGLKHRLVSEKETTKELVTDISHQLKTPVAALGMTFELMEDKQVTEEEKKEFADRGKKEVKKLSHLMGTLTNLSRLEADLIRLDRKEESLKKTLVRAVNGIYMKASEKHIEIEMDAFSDIKIFHDSRWTAEAIANVLDNAVKYSPEYSRVSIRVETQVSCAFISIRDEGIGIAKADYQNIFKRFYRSSVPQVAEQEGAGVGLYLARQILEEQGGSIRALPARGKGTVFQLMLPKKYGY